MGIVLPQGQPRIRCQLHQTAMIISFAKPKHYTLWLNVGQVQQEESSGTEFHRQSSSSLRSPAGNHFETYEMSVFTPANLS